jgi:UDP-N-acetylglucosamine--N-acetylmuramyl-(pentapeptide) pyrophosphoryl-undecaprenol N-acetylglucosamine transferase
MPLRVEFEHLVDPASRAELRRSFGLDPDALTLVVTGGSLGARSINGAVSAAVPDLRSAGVQILHITGRQTAPIGSQAFGHVVLEYCDRMRDALACADLVVSRAGSTIFEIASWAKPSIIIPLPNSISHDQTSNAYAYGNTGAASVIEENIFISLLVIK